MKRQKPCRLAWQPDTRPSDKITTNTSENRNVFSIFLIPLFGCAFAALFCWTSKQIFESAAFTKVIPAQR
jgi:hypothetical protein